MLGWDMSELISKKKIRVRVYFNIPQKITSSNGYMTENGETLQIYLVLILLDPESV